MATGWTVRVRAPMGARDFLCLALVQARPGAHPTSCTVGRLRLKCDATRAETRFCLSAKRASAFKSAGASVQSTTGSRGVRVSGSNAGYTMFRGSEGYWLPTPFASFPFASPPVRHRVPPHSERSIPVSFPR